MNEKQTSGSGDGVLLFVETLLGNMKGAPLPETLRERQKEVYYVRGNNALYAGIPLHRGPVGEPGGDSLAGTL